MTSQDVGRRRLQEVTRRPFDEVVAEHGAAVLRVCRATVGSGAAADAWSETFLSALRSYPDLEAGTNVRAWLLTIARRRSIDQLRARGRAAVPSDVLPERPAVGADPDEALPDQDLLAALAFLSPRQRDAVVYRYMGDLSYDEVGELIGSNATAARRSAADGIAALRTHYRSGGAT